MLMVFAAVLALGEHREWAVGSARAPANLPEWSKNDLEKKNVSRGVNIFDFDVFCHFLKVVAVFRKCLITKKCLWWFLHPLYTFDCFVRFFLSGVVIYPNRTGLFFTNMRP